MRILSITSCKEIHYGLQPVRVYDESEVFLDISERPTCPECRAEKSNDAITVHGLIEQIGFWDNVVVAVCHCGWCNEDFAVRRISEGEYDVGEEAQNILPLMGLPEFAQSMLKTGNGERR